MDIEYEEIVPYVMDVEIDDLMQGFADIEMGPAVKEVLVCMPK
jgi:hypothetical protein